MSRENVEIVGRVYAAFNSEDLERILALMHPDFETAVPPELSPEPDTYRGHNGIRRYFDSFREAMNEIRFDQGDSRGSGASVVVAVRLSAKGRSTGILVEQHLGQVWTVRNGKATHVRSYASYPDALTAVGLAE
jgi:ketosteroid isomerase-like protein